jgi:hypothetical protein
MQKYLLYISFDTNDGDYVYGTQIITEKEKEIIDRNDNKEVNFGSFNYDLTRKLHRCIDIKPITESEAEILTKFGFENFGEGNDYWIEELE